MKEFKLNDKSCYCPVELTLEVIGGKWKALIIWNLHDEIKRYGELRKNLEGITHKMLTQQLRELEEDGIVKRQVYPVVPPKVEYSLTERGLKLKPVFAMMGQWGKEFAVKEESKTSKAKDKNVKTAA